MTDPGAPLQEPQITPRAVAIATAPGPGPAGARRRPRRGCLAPCSSAASGSGATVSPTTPSLPATPSGAAEGSSSASASTPSSSATPGCIGALRSGPAGGRRGRGGAGAGAARVASRSVPVPRRDDRRGAAGGGAGTTLPRREPRTRGVAAQGGFLARARTAPGRAWTWRPSRRSCWASQVIGLYDDKAKTLSIVQRGGAFGPLERSHAWPMSSRMPCRTSTSTWPSWAPTIPRTATGPRRGSRSRRATRRCSCGLWSLPAPHRGRPGRAPAGNRVTQRSWRCSRACPPSSCSSCSSPTSRALAFAGPALRQRGLGGR